MNNQIFKIVILFLLVSIIICGCQPNTESISPSEPSVDESGLNGIIPNHESETIAMTNEEKGVPDRLVSSDVEAYLREQYNDCIDYRIDYIVHGVDTSLHRDFLGMYVECIYDYAMTPIFLSMVYQYEKSNDIWTLIPDETEEIRWDMQLRDTILQQQLSGSAEGEYEWHDHIDYNLTITDYDLEKAWVNVYYEIYSEKSNSVYTGQVTLGFNNEFWSTHEIEEGIDISLSKFRGLTVS